MASIAALSLVVGARNLRAAARTRQSQCFPMAIACGPSPFKVAAVALANQMARDYLGASASRAESIVKRGDDVGDRPDRATPRNSAPH